MEFSEANIKDLQNRYKQLYGTDISREDALMFGSKLISALSITYKEITKEEYEKYNKQK